MSARRMLSLVGTAVGGLIGWSETPPSADPASLWALLGELGVRPGDSDDELAEALRKFQARAGLEPDGIAGPRTVHLLSRYAKEARELRQALAA